MIDQIGVHGPQRADVAAVVGHDDVAADRRCDLVEQLCAVYLLRPRFGFRERDRVALLAVVVEAEPPTLIAHQTIENSSAHIELLGRTFALLLVLKRRE